MPVNETQPQKPFIVLCMDKAFCEEFVKTINPDDFDIHVAYNAKGEASDIKGESALRILAAQGNRHGFLITDENTAEDTGTRLLIGAKRGRYTGLNPEAVYTICITGSDKSFLKNLRQIDKYFSYALDRETPLTQKVAELMQDKMAGLASAKTDLISTAEAPPASEAAELEKLYESNPGYANYLAYKDVQKREEGGDAEPGAAQNFLEMLREQNKPISFPKACNPISGKDVTESYRER